MHRACKDDKSIFACGSEDAAWALGNVCMMEGVRVVCMTNAGVMRGSLHASERACKDDNSSFVCGSKADACGSQAVAWA